MRSITKPVLSHADITRLIRQGLGDDAVVTGHEEFTDGFFNAAHAVRLADGREVVLKVAPEKGLTMLTYEVDLMHTEIEFFERAAAAGVPLPTMWHADAEGGVMVMERLRGVSFEQAKQTMAAEHVLAVRHELGRIAAAGTAVTGERFGYPRRDGRTRSASWRESFLCFVDDILADATATDRPLARPAAEIRELVARHAPLLDAVTAPALVHFDLWDGNVFVLADGDGWRVEAVIDGERAFYGDPIAELVSLATWIPEEQAAAAIDGFLGRALTADEQTRLTLYRIYLWLILVAETAVRGYPEKENGELLAMAGGQLAADLDRLAAV
ncbi:phosphotransferase family protein [Catellatospora citrea]|uniref:Phosphotransferase n=1 Tax=Catellatospora citrea TaxID=53366 RepID=A0A8J3KJK4_9ACTN|nr:aminoglycoside phosphotransferase family protein [Catellatospora citrea]RKE12459.1 fructosamine-3-kinase [Catellatospora citrea]GIF96309.1 phosphotransferase [Catellatospora citrea]